MKKDIFAVCDPESSYALRLTAYLQEKQGAVFEVLAFTSEKSLCAFAREHEISLLLLSAQVSHEEVSRCQVGKILLLSEGEMTEEEDTLPCVFKYQAADRLISEVMKHYGAEKRAVPQAFLKRDLRQIAIYSPAEREGKTAFALALGQALARDRRALYLNMEGCSGLPFLLRKEPEADFADLMYFVKQKEGSFTYRIQGIVQSVGELDYIPPFPTPMDVRGVTVQEWMTLLEEISRHSVYDRILLQLDETADGFLDILKSCDTIYMPVWKDAVSKAKLLQYKKMLKLAGYEELMEKTKELRLPEPEEPIKGEYAGEQLLWGEYGAFVRKLILEEREHV